MTATQAQLDIRKGAVVRCHDQDYVIVHVVGLDSVLGKNLETGSVDTLPIADLRPPPSPEEKAARPKDYDLLDVSKEDWDKAKERLRMITPLLKRHKHGEAKAVSIAKTNGIAFSTLYAWRRAYLATGLLSSLLPVRPDGGRGKSRIKNEEVEKQLEEVIHNYYMTDQKPTIAATMEKLTAKCDGLKLPVPNINTLRLRIQWLSSRAVVAAREGERAARLKFDANEGSVPDAEWPLATVMMDHTELPVMIVHEVTRQQIGRPWVTFAIDVHSRVVPGMHLSLDHPSAMSAGMCVSHAILPKEKWLTDRGIEAEWPCWGVMGSLHMDNAREFRGNMLKAACEHYLIDLKLRPVKTPHYGGHIERLMGTVSEELKKIPGTTFSGPKEKGEYDAEGKAVMTLAELERWLTYFIAKYHHRIHSGIGMSPLQKYKEGLIGTKGRPGRGLPARRLDEEKVRIDFMPYEERTIQDYGVLWDLHYFDDILRPWINSTDPDNSQLKRQFRFRRDPRDISVIYFFEPNVKRYYPIHYRDLSLPPISLWEFREAKREARKAGLKEVDERAIFGYVRKMREEVEQAKEKTKAARRRHQKTLEHAKARERRKTELPKVTRAPKPAAPPPAIPGYDPSQVTPYEDD